MIATCVTLNGLVIIPALLVLGVLTYACIRWYEWKKECEAFSNLCSDLYNENIELQCHEPFPEVGHESWRMNAPVTEWYGKQVEEVQA